MKFYLIASRVAVEQAIFQKKKGYAKTTKLQGLLKSPTITTTYNFSCL